MNLRIIRDINSSDMSNWVKKGAENTREEHHNCATSAHTYKDLEADLFAQELLLFLGVQP
jgi:hypothetical protein